jgi:alkylation response protein AidB-like acyl-CoA dehydrogenase
VIRVEQEAFVSGVDDALRIRLQDAARAAGVLAPQAPAEFGGGGGTGSLTRLSARAVVPGILVARRGGTQWRA